MKSLPVSLERILENYMFSFMSDVFTVLPAVIVSVQDIAECRVSVMPCTTLKYKDGTELILPEILNIPLCFPVSTNAGMTFQVSQGDTVLIVFSMRSIDKFKSGIKNPSSDISERYMDINDAIALVGLNTFPDSVLDMKKHNLRFDVRDVAIFNNIGKGNETKILLKYDGGISVYAPSSDVDITAKKVTIEGDLIVSGKVESQELVSKEAYSGSFVSLDGKTLFVKNGVIYAAV